MTSIGRRGQRPLPSGSGRQEGVRLRDKVVVVTGASSGIGRAIVNRLAATDASIVGIARDLSRLRETKAEVEGVGGRMEILAADLSDPEAAGGAMGSVLGEHGRVDVLVNNAGRSIRRSVAQSTDRLHDFQRTMAVNYFGAVALILAVLPSMRDRRQGHIVNISSIGCQLFPGRFSAYVASKLALDGFSRCLAAEVAGDGIAVTTIHMPLVRTPMIAPTWIYRAFPTISAAEAAQVVVRALVTRPHEVSSPLGRVTEICNALVPGLPRLVMTEAYRAFPDTASADPSASGPMRDPGSWKRLLFRRVMGHVHL